MATTLPEADPVDALTHDHRHLTELVLVVRDRLRAIGRGAEQSTTTELAAGVEHLRDELLMHFALEEEGLFPFVAVKAPELRQRAAALEAAHDAVCGAVSRLLYLAQRPSGDSARRNVAFRALFERFEESYAAHAQDEVAFLRELGAKLDAADRSELCVLLRGL